VFNKKVILNILSNSRVDANNLTKADRTYLREKFFPGESAASILFRPALEKIQQEEKEKEETAAKQEKFVEKLLTKLNLREKEAFVKLETLDSYMHKSNYGVFGDEYWCNHTLLIQIAKAKRRYGTTQSVTSFTKWLMSLYLKRPQPEVLSRGKKSERIIADNYKHYDIEGWELVYRDPLIEKPVPFEISRLRINGKSIWGVPDLVYKNTASNEIYIIERKTCNYPVPINGWPNLKAQLWAYAHIDKFQYASKIHLIGEIWGGYGNNITRRCIQHWDINDPEFYYKNKQLFDAYGGTVNR